MRKSCGYCGVPELHSRKACPAAKPGVVCKNCYGENYFANVCRSPKNRFKYSMRKPVAVNSLEQENHDTYEYDSNDCAHNYALSVDNDSNIPVRKLFVTFKLSVDGENFKTLKFQVDTAASCNTMPYEMFRSMSSSKTLGPSKSILHSYSGKSIRPLGKCTALSESDKNLM